MRLLYFAWVRERIGRAEEDFAPPDGVCQVDQLIDALVSRGEGYAAAFLRRSTIRCAVNQVLAGPSTPIAPDDEVAFFPPVTGG